MTQPPEPKRLWNPQPFGFIAPQIPSDTTAHAESNNSVGTADTPSLNALDGPEIISQINDLWRVTVSGLILCLETQDSEVGWIVTGRANTLERLVAQAIWDPLDRREMMHEVRLGLVGSRC